MIEKEGAPAYRLPCRWIFRVERSESGRIFGSGGDVIVKLSVLRLSVTSELKDRGCLLFGREGGPIGGESNRENPAVVANPGEISFLEGFHQGLSIRGGGAGGLRGG